MWIHVTATYRRVEIPEYVGPVAPPDRLITDEELEEFLPALPDYLDFKSLLSYGMDRSAIACLREARDTTDPERIITLYHRAGFGAFDGKTYVGEPWMYEGCSMEYVEVEFGTRAVESVPYPFHPDWTPVCFDCRRPLCIFTMSVSDGKWPKGHPSGWCGLCYARFLIKRRFRSERELKIGEAEYVKRFEADILRDWRRQLTLQWQSEAQLQTERYMKWRARELDNLRRLRKEAA